MENANRKPINYKLIFKITSAILFIMFFIPTMTVSCAAEDVGVTAGHAMLGYYSDMYGEIEVISYPQLWLIFPLVIPIVMFVFACVRLQDVKTNAAVITVLSVLDIVLWIVFRNGVKGFADENMCEFETNFGYILVMILLAFNIVITVALFANILPDRSQVMAPPDMIYAPPYIVSDKWICPNCNVEVAGNAKFCNSCGTPKPEPAAPQISNQTASDTPMFCPSCGKPITPDTVFCAGCGEKVLAT